jgi:hypothetical protein
VLRRARGGSAVAKGDERVEHDPGVGKITEHYVRAGVVKLLAG